MNNVVDLSLPGLWAKYESLHDIPISAREAETEQQTEARLDAAYRIGGKMASMIPTTPAEAVILVRLLREYGEMGMPPEHRQERVCDNLITGLERMDAT